MPDDVLKRLYATDDAQVWAEEFMAVVNRPTLVDEGLMIGWFANAIETAKRIDKGRRSSPPAHEEGCRWVRTVPGDCDYRSTHHYCPHPEHACDCSRSA